MLTAPQPVVDLRAWLRRAADAQPDAVALVSAEGSWQYRALLDRVQTLAAQLSDAGLSAGDVVAIAATRDAQTIIHILACVQAQVAYMPLDLSYPADRLVAMLDDALARVVLGCAPALAELQQQLGRALPSLAEPAPRSAKAQHAQTNDLCYVLFTSGSTGRPKGVAMGKTPLAHLIQWHADHPRLGQPARTLQFAPLSFDVHFQEIFSTVATGGTLVLVDDATRRDPALLHRALVAQRIERVFAPYVALQMIAQAADNDVPASLREVISAGEQLQITPAIRRLFARLPGAELHNHYGPTESHVVTAHELRGDPALWPDIPPIGLPLHHVRIALRDANTGQPTAADTGELLLGGHTLAHGYLGRAELSAERFRNDISGLPGVWYTTGDLVRRDAHGACTYLGRVDQQLKVDGFRIEPGEIELAIMASPEVSDAVVTAPEIAGLGKQLMAHVVLKPGADAVQLGSLRARLQQCLPAYMVPVRFMAVERLPTTPSGKIDRRNLPLPPIDDVRADWSKPHDVITRLWCDLLGVASIDAEHNLFDIGARSLLVMRFVARIKELGGTLTVSDVYDRPTINGLAQHGNTAAGARPQRARTMSDQRTRGIAIVGMATRTAGARTAEQFWANLVAGVEGIRHFQPHELDPSVAASLRERPNFVAARGVIEEPGRFDAAFFGVSAREATVLDPQQRLMLELAWNALESACIDTERGDLRVGVFAGTANNSYAAALRQEAPELVQQYGEFATMLASEKDYVATRVAHKLNLNGPAVSVHTACSTGLVAVCQAWQALAAGQCNVALAGGVTLTVPQESGYLYVEGSMESADGHCRPFDAQATGTVFANAGAVVALKRVEDAERDGDTIYAVIRGVGLNNDGADKASFTAPSVSGQAGAIRMALDHAGIDARSIGYVEAHGTGTALGDPIEVAGLTRAWREDTADSGYCTLGSLKGNLGHTVAAAGVLGLIKTALSLHHELVPATLHYGSPNPQIDFSATPFVVSASNTAWPRSATPRRAAVSSFGVGGTNAHVVIEEGPARASAPSNGDTALHLLPLSARSPEAALQRAQDLAVHLEQHPTLPLAEVAATLMRGRRAMPQRLAVAARNASEAAAALRKLKSAHKALNKPRLVFLFPGQGSQHPGMARALYDELPAFRVAFDACLNAADAELAQRLRHWLLACEPSDSVAAQALAETRHAQPAMFAVCHSLAAWLDSLGLKPDALIGHSIGEYAAACHAGVFSVQDAMSAVIARGQAMFAQPPGAMLAVRAAADAVRATLPAGVEIAGCNAPALTVVAGGFDAIAAYAKQLEAQDIGTTALKVSHAFHSASMDGALPLVAQAVQRLKPKAPQVEMYSCSTGALLQADQATEAPYWSQQVRAPVQFTTAVQAELARGDAVFVEVGPGQALTALLRQHRTAQGEVPRIASLLGPAQDPGDASRHAMNGLGLLWSHGVPVHWPVAANARRAALPTYPFQGERYWFARRTEALSIAPAPHAPAEVDVGVPMSRLPAIDNELKRILSDLSGLAREELNNDATFLDQGLDSLSLTQATLEFERVFGIKLRFRRLLEDLDTVGKLGAFLDAEMPADKFAAPKVSAVMPAAPSTPMTLPAMPMAADGSLLQTVIAQQMQLMAQQLALLSGQPAAVVAPPSEPAAVAAVSEAQTPSAKSLVEKPFGASARISLDKQNDFTPAQRRWLDDFIARYVARSGSSKTFSQQHRKVMADPRVVTGFNPLWKDLVYPIVANRSDGARLWDIDGNEYIDLLSCFGSNLLGYQPKAVIDAMAEQLQRGIEVGPQHPLAAEVAELISDATGMERVAFCNTGSEAVMGAMRVARTVTGRKTIAIFSNSYHGIFDEVIVRGTKQLRSISAAPGILANAVEHILVLDWASDESLKVLRERGHELAAIMTEPIQNKYPTVQPREFLHALRQIASDNGCALIFDEVVTGFRVAPGGAQEFYGVRADMCTYGKIIGGGLPFAAIAGASPWLDALDGGHWQYGDDSYPEAGVTYFAGTFVRHPLALAAARATLQHLKRGGRALYQSINDRTQRLIDRLNTAFAARGAPCKAVHCASLWRLQWDDGQRYVSLFYYLLRFHGLHCYEQFGHFVTEAMTEADTQRIFEVFTKSLDELMALGFIRPRDGTLPPSGGKPDTSGSGDAAVAARAVTPADGGSASPSAQHAPLTPGQSERWLAAAFDDHARRALNESFYVLLQGEVNAGALKAALQDVLQRHEAFRISFDRDEPIQHLGPPNTMLVTEVDLRSDPDTAAALDTFCTNASRRDFDLSQAPLMAVSLLHLSDGRMAVHMVASHLVFDGWASSVFNAELRTAYNARKQGQAPPWPQAATSPLQFARTQEAAFAGPQGQEALAYWRGVMANPPRPLALGDLTPTKPRRYAANTVHRRLDAALTASIRQHAKASKATLFHWLLAGVTLLLQRRAQQNDLVVSVPYASQGLSDPGPLLADGVLDLPLRLRCEPEMKFTGLLQHVRGQVMDALEAPRTTQGTLARAMGLRSLGDRPPLSSIFFNLNPKVDVSGFDGLAATFQEGRKQGTLNDLFFNFYDQGDTLSFDLHHSADLFSPALAQSLVDEMLALYQQAAEGNDAPIGTWPAASAVSIDPRLAAWNATERPLQAHPRFERWISAQAQRTPDHVAVTAGTQRLTYRDIEHAANRIAHVLLARGVGHGDLVGMCLSRGAHLLPALLGVLKTGAAYVPLDPHFPVERLQYMAQDAQLKLAITEAAHADKCGVERDAQLRVDDDAAAIQAASADEPRVSEQWPANAPAYVIYTSGSTGQPKGVALPQDAVCNFLASMRDVPSMHGNDKLLAVTTLSFDIAVLELFLPLTIGANVVLATRDEIMDGEVLSRKLTDERITVLQATPTTWHLLLDAGWRAPAGFKALCGGEALPPALAKALLEQNIELWNMYGPTETTVWSTCWRITDATQKISIGTPIANTQVWIVDEQLRPVPVGGEGEICIGGHGVALGYFKRPELTAEKFIADPFSKLPGARLYRTGDLGRWREDGQLEHLGRMDFQVKVRGYRIELGEIEAACTAFDGVAQAVVTAPELSPGNVQLVAYIVPKMGATPDSQALRAQLKRALPDYMVPQQVVSLANLPLLPNGKVNRKALPMPELGSAAPAAATGVPPANDAEAKVLEAMRAVLNQPALGVTDNFFDMGGHSLAAARLATRLRKAFDATLPIRTIFESPTARALAAAFATLDASQMVQRAPVIHDPQRTQAPLTPMQARIRFMESMQPGRVVYNTPSAHRLRGPMNVPLFQQAFALLVQRQSTLRTFIAQAEDGSYVQRVADTVSFEWPLQDLSHLPPDEREAELTRRLRAELDTPIEITEAPLFRVALYRLADDDHGFLFMPHHIIWDGWSFDLLYEEMAALYGALLRGQTPNLPLPPVTYGDYAAWYADWLQSDEANNELDYWRQRFVNAPVPRPLGTDRPRKAGMSGLGGAQFVHIDNATTEKLRAVATSAGATLNMLTLTVYAAMMSDATDGEHIVVGSPLRGRLAPEIEQVMGFFNNMLPMHLRLPRSARLSDAMRQVKADLMDVFSHQNIPFEVLAADPAIGRRLQHGGLYQVMFSFQDARERHRDWGGLKQQSILIFQRGATEDMGLWMMDIPKGMEGGFIYNTDVYNDSTAEALRACYLDMLHHIAEHGDTTIAELCAFERSGASDVLRRLKPQLAAVASSTAPAPTTHWVRSQDEQALAVIWADLLDLDVQTIQPEQSFFDLGGNSLLAMSLVAEINRRLNVRLGEAVIMDSPSIPALARALRAPPKSTSLVTVRMGAPAAAKPPVFLIHDADGQVLLYHNLAFRLDEGRAVHGLQPLIDEHGQPVHTRIEDMARHYVAQIKTQQPSGPYAVGGLCAGGVIAFEVALQLQKQGDRVGLVALIDAVDVGVSESNVKVAKVRLKKLTAALAGHADLPLPQRLIASASTLARKAKSYLSYEIQRHSEQAQKASQVQALRQQRDAAAPATSAAQSLDRVTLRTVYNDAATIYKQSAKLTAPVLLLRATQGSGEQADRPMIEMVSDPTLGWQRHVQGRIDCVDVAGGHSTILQQPHVEDVALAMQRHLDRMGILGAQPVAA